MSVGRTDVFRSGRGAAAAQPELWQPSWLERLADCPLVLALPELVESVLGERLRCLYGNGGGVPYDPVPVFSVWLYAYLDGERSTRKVENLCKYDVRYEYLSGSCRPDYTTLSRFRQRLLDVLDELFMAVVKACRDAGLVKCKTVAIDGTKIMARKSQWRRALEQSEASDAFEEEARTMLTTHGEYIVGYNVQAVVDTEHSIVVAYVATNQVNDLNLLPAVLEATEKLCGMLPEEAVMDKGYDSGTNATCAREKGVVAVIPAAKQGKHPFIQDENGVMRCLAGHQASQGTWMDKGKPYDVYKVSRCRNCPLKGKCGLKKGHQREMKVMVGTCAKDKAEANARAKTPEGKQLLRLRGPTVERRFSFLKREQGLNRLLLIGLEGVDLECGLAFIGQNLRALQRAVLARFRRFLAPKTKDSQPRPQAGHRLSPA